VPLLDIQKGYVRRNKVKPSNSIRPEMRHTIFKKRSTDPQSYSGAMNSFHTRSIACRFSAETFKLDRRGKVMGSMLPDEIIIDPSDYEPRKFDAAIVFADISGFTHLSEEYNKPGKGGPSRLSIVLNSYIGSIVQEILLHGGDVLKFAGDALLIMFKVSAIFSLQDSIKSAMDSAVLIQKTCGQRQTDVGVTLRVKIAISAGELYFSLIGNELSSHYVVVGQPIWDVKHAEKLCNPGDIIVTKTGLFVCVKEMLSWAL
jgi:class 3 adenylate cyclase